jgi:thioredoxin reductase (NADPH)
LILSGFHEASLALRKAYAYALPDQKRVHIHSSYDQKLSARILGDSASSAGVSGDKPLTPRHSE